MTEPVAGIVDALEQTVGQARAMPMSASVLVNRAEVLELVHRLRTALRRIVIDSPPAPKGL